MRVEVVNKARGEQGVYCGRGSGLGNPFPLHKESDRDHVCDLYREWFDRRIAQEDEQVLSKLRELYRIGQRDGVVRLQCYCAPRRCHCDTIKAFLESMESTEP